MVKKIFFLFLLISLTISPFSSFADESIEESVINKPVDMNAKCSINLNFTHRGVVFENEPVELYRVATISPQYIFTLTEEFEETGVTLNGAVTKGEWNTIRTTIENFIVSERILPLDVAFTDENGKITFENLEPGMYFTSSVHTSKNDVGYAFDSVISSLPNLKNGEPVYDVEVNTKPFREDISSKKVRYRISKLWKDEGYQELRPQSIEVCIFKDKELHEKVILNNDNNWFYSWEAEDDGSVWNVSEINLTGNYVKLIEKRNTSFIIINEYEDNYYPEEPSKPGIPTETDGPSTPNVPLETNEPSQSDEPSETTVPDVLETPSINTSRPSSDVAPTGDTTNFETYIIVMCLTGAALIIVSIIGNKALKKDND